MSIKVTVVVDQDGRQAVFTRSFDSLTDVSNALPGLDGEEWLVAERQECPYCNQVFNAEPGRDALRKHAEYCEVWPGDFE